MSERFDIITEADARRLPPGSAVVLRQGGHVTPLAADTLRERRIRLVREDDVPEADIASLVPVADIRRIAICTDHTGIALKARLVEALRGRGLAVEDVGTHDSATVDYPDIAARVARIVARAEADMGIVIDGGGIGSAVSANKIHGVRAAMCPTETLARYARQHNGCNVLTLGSTLVTAEEALRIVETWMSTTISEGRYIRRLVKIEALERSGR
jgi:ribose 5-phosphate isomerase B